MRSVAIGTLFLAIFSFVRAQEPSATKDIRDRLDLAFWDDIKDKRQPALFEAYLEKFPNGWFAPLAKARLAELKAGSDPASNTLVSIPITASESSLTKSDRSGTAIDLLRQTRERLGGEAISSLRDWKMAGSAGAKNIFGKEQRTPFSKTYCATGQTRWVFKRGTESFFDGEQSGWTLQSNIARFVSENTLRVRYAQNFAELPNLLNSDRLSSAKIEREGDHQIRITSAFGDVVILDIDPSSGLPSRLTLSVALKEAAPSPVTRTFSEWKPINGAILPFKWTEESGDTKSLVSIVEWKLNGGVSCDQLARTPKNIPIQPVRNPVIQTNSIETDPSYAARDTEDEARALLERVQRAVGGVDRIAGVRDYKRVFQQITEGIRNNQVKSPRIIESWCSTGSWLQQIAIPLRRDEWVYFNGKDAGWVKRGSSVAALTASMIESLKAAAFQYDFFGMLLADRREGTSLSLDGPSTLRILDAGGSTVVLEIDPKTSFPTRRQSQYFSKRGIGPVIEDRFSNWQEDYGLSLPRTLIEYRSGVKSREAHVLEWNINAGIDCAGLGKTPH